VTRWTHHPAAARAPRSRSTRPRCRRWRRDDAVRSVPVLGPDRRAARPRVRIQPAAGRL